MLKRKSQTVSIDLFMAVFVFIILLILIISSWNIYQVKIVERMAYEDIMVNAFQIADLLVKSRGYPLEWNSTNVEVIGLAASDRIISSEKLNSFFNISYSSSKELLNIERYDFYFQVKHINGTAADSYGLESNGTYSVSAKRYVLYENEKAIIDFKLWK